VETKAAGEMDSQAQGLSAPARCGAQMRQNWGSCTPQRSV